MRMDDKKLMELYKEAVNKIASLEQEENVKNYIQAIKDKEVIEDELRLFVVDSGYTNRNRYG
jgi:hypothetical protein